MKNNISKIKSQILKAVNSAQEKGWTIKPKVLVTWEPYGKECCPLGAVALFHNAPVDPEKMDLSIPALFLNVNKRWAFEFSSGFDGFYIESSLIRYPEARELGAELRKELK